MIRAALLKRSKMKLILYIIHWYAIAFYSFLYFKAKAFKDACIDLLTFFVFGSDEEYSELDNQEY